MAVNKETSRGRAETAFAHSEERDRLVMKMIEKERAAVDANTARLKALRLAKEAAEPAKQKHRTKLGKLAPKIG